MKFFSYLKKDKLIRETLILIFLLWVFLSAIVGLGISNYYNLYYSNQQDSSLFVAEPYLKDYDEMMTSLELFITESEEITHDEFHNYCDGLCSKSSAIDMVSYAPLGVIEYVHPTTKEDEFLNFDILNFFDTLEIQDFQNAMISGEMFITYKDAGSTMVFHKPVVEHGVFLGIICIAIDLEALQQELETLLPVDDTVLYTDDSVFLVGESSSNLSNYNVVDFDVNGETFYIGTNFHSPYYKQIIYLVMGIDIAIFLLLSIIFLLTYRNQKRVIEFMDHIDYTYHYNLDTGLRNKTSLYEDFAVISKESSTLFIAFGMFNNVKFINYKYGHEMGKNVVKEAISLIQGVLRNHTVMYHLGGDEYAFIFKVEEANEVRNIVSRILRVFERDIVIKRIRTNISLSMGIVSYPNEGKTVDELIRNAHLTLSQSKIINSNDYAFFSSNAIKDLLVNQDFDEYVNKLDLNIFDVFLMPIVDCKTNRIVGFECLSRAFNEFQEMIDTASVVASLERNGRIQELDEIVFKKMLVFMEKINATYPKNDLFLSVNASALSFNENYVEKIIQDFKESKLKHGTIVLELTESYKVEDHDYLIRLFKQLNKAGIRTAIDDFGSGYSSISYISKFPIYSIKVDKEYVRDYYKNNFNRTLFLTLRSIAEVLDCKLVAEGVDDPETLDFLRENDCEWYQGYLFSKGIPFEQALKLIKTKNFTEEE